MELKIKDAMRALRMSLTSPWRFRYLLILSLTLCLGIHAMASTVDIRVEVQKDRHPISPLIYGVNFANSEQATLLNITLNRNGGNATTCYNWEEDATNSGNDWYFMSHPDGNSNTPSGSVDAWVRGNMAAKTTDGVRSMVTIPMIGWAAKLGPNRSPLWSFSVKKYGAQQRTEQYHPDMGNGFKPNGQPITGNDPNDAQMPVTVDFEKRWVNHLVGAFGSAKNGGISYYLLDNETGLWQSTHRDVFPSGLKMDDLFSRELKTAEMIKSVDPTAMVCGTEAWGWPEYFNSGYDNEWAGKHHYQKPYPDQSAHGGMELIPWILQQFAAVQKRTGKRYLDVLTVHYYPQENGVSSKNADPATVLLRNRSTRALWDPKYVDESWIRKTIDLIPLLKKWVKTYFPGTKIGITEYSWGAEDNISGAIAEADVLGIFGREGLYLANRWTCPKTDSPAFNAIRMYRNYNGKDGVFGDISVACQTPDPDTCAAFASEDGRTNQLKIMILNKQPGLSQPVTLNVAGYQAKPSAEVYQLTVANHIEKLANVGVKRNTVSLTLPEQSITLLILNPAGG